MTSAFQIKNQYLAGVIVLSVVTLRSMAYSRGGGCNPGNECVKVAMAP